MAMKRRDLTEQHKMIQFFSAESCHLKKHGMTRTEMLKNAEKMFQILRKYENEYNMLRKSYFANQPHFDGTFIAFFQYNLERGVCKKLFLVKPAAVKSYKIGVSFVWFYIT